MTLPSWVLQDGGVSAHDIAAFSSAAQALNCDVHKVTIIPFSHEVSGTVPELDGPVIVYGSSGLANVAMRLGWLPVAWDGPKLDQSRDVSALGSMALNVDLEIVAFSQCALAMRARGWDRAFLRPDAEGKEFSGRVLDVSEAAAWVQRMQRAGYLLLQTIWFASHRNAGLGGNGVVSL